MSQFRQTPFRKTALPKLTAMRAHSGTNSWKVQLMTHLWHKENNEKPNRIRERERSREDKFNKPLLGKPHCHPRGNSVYKHSPLPWRHFGKQKCGKTSGLSYSSYRTVLQKQFRTIQWNTNPSARRDMRRLNDIHFSSYTHAKGILC